MKMIEITYNKYQKELEKLNEKLERAKKTYAKKLETAKKYGVAEWTRDDRRAWAETVETTESGFFVNKADGKKNGAWFDLSIAEGEIKDIEKRIERAESRLNKSEEELNRYHEKINRIMDLKEKEKLMQAEFEKEQKEWKKDGITLESRYTGLTPQGKQFSIYGNNGITNRSLHCFQLIIEGETIFTSGEFWRAYSEIKRR